MSQDYTDTGRDAFLTWAEGELRRKTFGHRIYTRGGKGGQASDVRSFLDISPERTRCPVSDRNRLVWPP